jgi:hypothetical protein
MSTSAPNSEAFEFRPKGVKLREPEDFDALRDRMGNAAIKALNSTFPKSFGGVRVELHDLHWGPEPDLSPEVETDALLNDKFLSRPLRAAVRLFDEKTGEKLDELPPQTVMKVPWVTSRGTIIHRGNHYTTASQFRLVPGPYGRIMDNGNVEVHNNVKPGTGSSWRVMLEPETGQLRLKVGESTGLHLYSLWKDLGVTDDEIKELWGEGTWAKNQQAYNPRTLGMAYSRFVPARLQIPGATVDQKRAAVLEAINKGTVLKSVVRRNLPELLDRQKRAAVADSLQAEDDLHKLFRPTLTPDDMQREIQSVYGRHGPRLASMKAWPSHWIDAQDPMGWIEWYMNYHEGRRSKDDTRQIRRWLRMKRTHGEAFVRSPSPRRAFTLRNWAIDPLRLLPEGQREDARKSMQKYEDDAWADWASKRASFSLSDLQAIASHLNTCDQAGIDPDGTQEQLELAIRQHLFHADRSTLAWQAAADEASIKKASFVTGLIATNPQQFEIEERAAGLLVSCDAGIFAMTL